MAVVVTLPSTSADSPPRATARARIPITSGALSPAGSGGSSRSPSRSPSPPRGGAGGGGLRRVGSGSSLLPGGGGRRGGRRQQRRRLALLVAAAGAWVVASSGLILVNKAILVDQGFPFPSLVASLGMVGSWLASTAACSLPGLVPRRSPRPTIRFLLTRVVPTGLAMAASVYLGNLSYLYLSVAYIQMLKALTPVATLLIALALRLERPSTRLAASVCLITAGVMGASAGEGRLSAFGVAAMVASVGAEALRLNITQLLMSNTLGSSPSKPGAAGGGGKAAVGSNSSSGSSSGVGGGGAAGGGGTAGMHPLEALMYLAPSCAAWMLLLSAVTEAPRLVAEPHRITRLLSDPSHFAVSCLAGFCVNALAFAVVSLSSALTLRVLAVCKDVGLVAWSAVALGEPVTSGQFVGYGISVLGVAWYNKIKLSEGGSSGSGRGSSISSSSGEKAAGDSGGGCGPLLPLSAVVPVGGGEVAVGGLRAAIGAALRRLAGRGGGGGGGGWIGGGGGGYSRLGPSPGKTRRLSTIAERISLEGSDGGARRPSGA